MLICKHTVVPLIVMMCLAVLGCADPKGEKPAAASKTGANAPDKAVAFLDDGVYPVVAPDKASANRDPGTKIVKLVSVPVEGSSDSTPEEIYVIGQPLLRFQNVSHFDFKFEKNECTEIGFPNTEELKAYTRDHVGSRLAMVVDNRVISSHKIRVAIETDRLRITCCTVGGGDHLHKHLKKLRIASEANPK